MGPGAHCYIPKFIEIGPLVPEKILRVSPVYGHGGHLDHMTNIILKHFHFPVPKSLHTKFGLKLSSCSCEEQVLILICK